MKNMKFVPLREHAGNGHLYVKNINKTVAAGAFTNGRIVFDPEKRGLDGAEDYFSNSRHLPVEIQELIGTRTLEENVNAFSLRLLKSKSDQDIYLFTCYRLAQIPYEQGIMAQKQPPATEDFIPDNAPVEPDKPLTNPTPAEADSIFGDIEGFDGFKLEKEK